MSGNTESPLEHYRKMATFDWNEMKKILDNDAEYSNMKMNVWKTLSSDPIFLAKSSSDLDETRKMAAKKLFRYLHFNILPNDILEFPYKKRLRYMVAVNEAFALALPDISIKHGIGVGVVKNAVATLGTERHKHFTDALWSGKVVGCIALTEVAHGSNTKLLKTTATFDKKTKEFILNSPNFEAAKCWVGNLGQTATIGIVFAQLVTNGENYGLHAFITPLRDPKTLLPYPGLEIGDMGEKNGLHGIDNGFVIFNNYRIPKNNLLNRIGDVNDDGEYESSFSEPGKLLGASLENLALPRVGIMLSSVGTLVKAVTIAVRYAAVRKQFSDSENGEEIPIIEYQLHQWRLFPYVSSAVVFKIFSYSFFEDYLNVQEISTSSSERFDEMNDSVSEVHSIISGSKPLLTWKTRDAIQECREACGGHGYLKAAGLGDLRNDHDAAVTYEGDNNVLQQQTSNWLIKQWRQVIVEGKNVSSPLQTASFLQDFARIKTKKYQSSNLENPQYIMECYEWLIIFLLGEITKVMDEFNETGKSRYFIRTRIQVYRCSIISRAYTELNIQRHFWKKINNSSLSRGSRKIFTQLGLLYSLSSLENHTSYFYQGNFCHTPDFTVELKETILKLCEELKPNIVSIVDALAPPDFILDSILGKSDGKVYEHLEDSLLKARGNSVRPEWWKEIIFENPPNFYAKSKL